MVRESVLEIYFWWTSHHQIPGHVGALEREKVMFLAKAILLATFLFKFLKSPIWTVAGHENFFLTKVVCFAHLTKDVIHGFYILHAHPVWSVNHPYSIIFCTTSKQNTFNKRAC